MKYLIITLFFFSVLSCQSRKEESKAFKVEYKGALKNFMIKGDISAKAELSDLKEIKHVYALGAVENLKGEIQIFDGEPFITSVENNTLKFEKTLEKKAALLVYASVENWVSIQIPTKISSYEQLEKFIEESANNYHINTNEPFPFLIEGTIRSFDWHVINWKEGDTIHTHKKHKTSGLHGSLNNKNVEMLGFYSNSHHAVFTHHTTNMHIHIKTLDKKVAGHLDGLTLGENMILKLPKK